MTCPCGLPHDYSNCCQPIHQDPKNAQRPEQLMRARYSAHVMKLIDFIVETYHSSAHAEEHRDGIIDTANLNWLKLTVLDAPLPDNNEGFVEFEAQYKENGRVERLHERSRFVFENEQWFYIDGEYPESNTHIKVGRNDPCPCGSGKKAKKCCY